MPHGATLWAGSVAGEQGQTCPWHGQTHLLLPNLLVHLLVPPMQGSGCSQWGLVLSWGWGRNHPSAVLGALRAVLRQPFDPALPCDAVSFLFISILPWFSVWLLISLKDAIFHPSHYHCPVVPGAWQLARNKEHPATCPAQLLAWPCHIPPFPLIFPPISHQAPPSI